MKEIHIFTDGACSGNPGPGGWGVVLRYGDHDKHLSGGEPATTNNRMEMMAAIMALEALTEKCLVHLTTDSKYVMQGITEWMPNWKKRNWRGSNNKPVKNKDLWELLDAQVQRHEVHWHWIKGHSGHAENEQADELARNAILAMAP